MAFSPSPLNYQTNPSSSLHSVCFLFVPSQFHSPSNSFRTLKFKPCFAHQAIKLGTQEPRPVEAAIQAPKRKRKPRPSFLDHIQEKWSRKLPSTIEKFPWQEGGGEGGEVKKEQSFGFIGSEKQTDENPQVVENDPVSFPLPSPVISAPWSHGSKPNKPFLNSVPEILDFGPKTGDSQLNGLVGDSNILDDEPSNGVSSSKNFGVSLDDNGGSIERNGRERKKRSNTEMAEKMIPEHELRRLRNVSLRMLERTKVGVAGITQALVDHIHEKWKFDEVVKLKFEEPLSLNMKRTHEILERRTGGLIIWRSGSSVVLYRGMTYNLNCVQSYAKQNQVNALHHSNDLTSDATHNGGNNSVQSVESFMPNSLEYLKGLSKEELMDLCELNHVLDELGPRYTDWLGHEPLPVDADLLPAVIPGYKPPFRLLPYGIRPCLRDNEVTKFRRLARTLPPHFALGRNRELQGLANAMVKLWERSAIAKIAIKRGVLNTRNERMAEELKKLTGGTLLSRNKEYIVFYRGNDFLPPLVTETLKERQTLTNLQQDEEEKARQRALTLVKSNSKASKFPLVAGTLTETTAATSRWGNNPSSEDLEEMMRDLAVAQHASSIRYLEKKLAAAKGKLRKAEKALAKVQEHLEPAELPSDLETLTDEERFLFRKVGLSMKPYLLLGRRGVYDGVIENMHLHWKYRELVKIIVKGKNLSQVKHIAISLEAESGGVLVSLDKTTKGYAIIVYRGKNYARPLTIRPKNLLTRRQALARSIELQRREALKHHASDLVEKIELMKSELEEIKAGKNIDTEKFSLPRLDDAYFSDLDDDEGEEQDEYLETNDSNNEDGFEQNELILEKR
ncbi:hypothetical protein SLEP1_g24936 [Rubroshorea leprosula]|uniref:CRM domain-containing protein n=1 Tax=Rubroshorea leprosula TaxID=152421 RepID=A0AAV5JNG5_9ROSI|nr:hypothetical protein SLEP1_g24936 [Rubroshorea leprosula]